MPPQALASQVGGHAGVMTTEDGSLLIKPALHRELEFYQLLQAENDELFAKLRNYTPKFLGTLKLEGQAVQSLVLENLSYKFLKPNILDVKLGRVLYDETASEEKVQRMIQTAKDTTSWETGVRLTGFQVYDNHTCLPINTPKSYGKTIKPSDLPDGIARFFPAAHPPEGAASGSDAHTEATRAGLPPHTLVPVLTSIRSEIVEIRDTLAKLEMRMVGGSLLVIYEAEWERAAAGIRKHLEAGATGEAEAGAEAGAEVGEGEVGEGEEQGEAEEEDSDEDEEDEDEEDAHPPAFVVKLIDFAHTRIEEGLGPDEGVLHGIDTVLKLLDDRLNEIKEKYNV